MGEAAEHTQKPARSETRDSQQAESGDEREFGAEPLASLLRLQRTIGNAAIARMIARGAMPLQTRGMPAGGEHLRRMLSMRLSSHPVQRQPQASQPPQNQSTAPPQGGAMNNGIVYQGQRIVPDAAACKEILNRILPEKGFEGASSYGSSFVNAGSDQKLPWALFADPPYIEQCQAAMRSAVTEFDEECRIFMEKFETVAGNLTDALLTNAEEQIHKEQEKLGMKAENYDTEAGTSTVYTAANKDYLAETKTAAATLGKYREEVDELGRKSTEARRKVEEVSTPRSPGTPVPVPPQPGQQFTVVQGPTGAPAVIPQSLLDEQEKTQKAWEAAEENWKKRAQDATGRYASLGPLLAGGRGTAERLKAFAAESGAQSEQKLGTDFAEKLANIQTVRSELGGRFSIWKQPTIISMTHQQMTSNPGQQRMVRDRVQKVQADEKATQEMYAAIALGLGLLAAIPTGGSSVLAGVALAASVTGAALSAYTAYEESQRYVLQKASANTSLDRAKEISQDEPSLFFLAIDIAGAIGDLAGARAAFVALKEAIAAAKAAKSLEKLPEVVGAMRRASIGASNQARVIDEILPAGGDIGKALDEIRQAFIRTAQGAADREMADIMRLVGEKALDAGRVIVIPDNKLEALEVLRFRLAGRGVDVDATANRIIKNFFSGERAVGGSYYPKGKFMVVKGNVTAESAAAVLIHEITHAGQDAMKMINKFSVYHNEFEAFKVQQRFVEMLPLDRVPPDHLWLLRATDQDIENHILTAYAKQGAVKPTGFDNAAVAEAAYNTLFQAGGAMK